MRSPSTRGATLAVLAPLLAACTVATPFRPGPAGSAAGGEGTAIVALSHAVLHAEGRDVFDAHLRKIVASLGDQPGLIGYSLRRQWLGNEVWTMTVWVDDASRERFVRGTRHRTAVAEAGGVLKSVRFRRFEHPAGEFPLTWDQALRRLEQPAAN